MKRYRLNTHDVVDAYIRDPKTHAPIHFIHRSGFKSVMNVFETLCHEARMIGQWGIYQCSANDGEKTFNDRMLTINHKNRL
jgi:hypothetical protein